MINGNGKLFHRTPVTNCETYKVARLLTIARQKDKSTTPRAYPNHTTTTLVRMRATFRARAGRLRRARTSGASRLRSHEHARARPLRPLRPLRSPRSPSCPLFPTCLCAPLPVVFPTSGAAAFSFGIRSPLLSSPIGISSAPKLPKSNKSLKKSLLVFLYLVREGGGDFDCRIWWFDLFFSDSNLEGFEIRVRLRLPFRFVHLCEGYELFSRIYFLYTN